LPCIHDEEQQEKVETELKELDFKSSNGPFLSIHYTIKAVEQVEELSKELPGLLIHWRSSIEDRWDV
jgi:hypothetical protein